MKPQKYHNRVSWDGSYIQYPIEYHVTNIGKFFEFNGNLDLERNQAINIIFRVPDYDPKKYSLSINGIIRVTSLDDIEINFYEDVTVSDYGNTIDIFNKNRIKCSDCKTLINFYSNTIFDIAGSKKLYTLGVLKHERIPIEWNFLSKINYLLSFKRMRSVNNKKVPFYLYMEFFETIINEEEIKKFMEEK